MKNINLNSDIGEGFGVYDIGNDTEMLKIVNSLILLVVFILEIRT